MSQQPVKKDPFKKFNFDEYILDADSLAESFLSPKRRMKLDTDSEGLELIKKKKAKNLCVQLTDLTLIFRHH